jgi:thiol:disulfide interchange protein DsbA
VTTTTAVAATVPAVAATAAAASASSAPISTSEPAQGDFRLGVDYEVLPTPQPTYGQGKIEVAEVFGYSCIHCAQFQPEVNAWKKTMPADVRWEYVPAAFGGIWDMFGRAYYAAQTMGVQAKTHDAVFNSVFVEKRVKTGTAEEIADLYANLGVDRTKFLATMNSFGVTAMLNRAKQFALRTGVSATPTLIINGKYRLNVTRDRGFEGMLATADYLIARERAEAKAAKTP